MLKRWGKNKWKALPFLIAAQLLVLPGHCKKGDNHGNSKGKDKRDNSGTD